jgi:hypothetical protein
MFARLALTCTGAVPEPMSWDVVWLAPASVLLSL